MDSGAAAAQDELEGSISRDGTDPLSLEARFEQEQGSLQIPDLYTALPPIKDHLTTDTSISQEKTLQECLPYLSASSKSLFGLNEHGIPSLEREDHVDFLHDAIQNARIIPYDVVRPWVLYWSLTAFSLLGEKLHKYQQRCTALKSWPSYNWTD